MCECEKLNKGAQLFRIRMPSFKFEELHDLGPDYEMFLASRKVWQCKKCGQLFAFMRIPYKDEEDILVRANEADWNSWNWKELADVASSVRWRGPGIDPRLIW